MDLWIRKIWSQIAFSRLLPYIITKITVGILGIFSITTFFQKAKREMDFGHF
jgi:hypothetical protein